MRLLSSHETPRRLTSADSEMDVSAVLLFLLFHEMSSPSEAQDSECGTSNTGHQWGQLDAPGGRRTRPLQLVVEDESATKRQRESQGMIGNLFRSVVY